MNLKTINLLLSAILIVILTLSCSKNEPEVPGGECYFDTIDAYIVIDSILPESNEVYFKLFNKSDNKEIIHQGHPIREAYPSKDCNSLNLFSVNDTFPVLATLITKGACAPYHIKLIDYPKCF